MSPGMTVMPEASMTSPRALEGAPGVIASMRPSRSVIVTSRTGAAPVPSMSVPARTMVMGNSLDGCAEYSPSSITLRAVDEVQERRGREKAAEVLGEEIGALVVVARDEAGDV